MPFLILSCSVRKHDRVKASSPFGMVPRDLWLANQLESAYRTYHRSRYIETDPIRYPHRYSNPQDIEVVAFYSALLSYGNVKAIFKVLDALCVSLGRHPTEWLTQSKPSAITTALSPLYHRFTTAEDLICLTMGLRQIYQTEGRLLSLFNTFHDASDVNIERAAAGFLREFKKRCAGNGRPVGGTMDYLLASPDRGSACKRLNLFLRWMVRRDQVDFGLWTTVSPGQLVMPLDAHIIRIARNWRLLKRKTANWKSAEELTDRLRRFSPDDPVKYDFALTRLGMRAERLFGVT
ncbi:MAG: TIGR02757 family protein [bacterium]